MLANEFVKVIAVRALPHPCRHAVGASLARPYRVPTCSLHRWEARLAQTEVRDLVVRALSRVKDLRRVLAGTLDALKNVAPGES